MVKSTPEYQAAITARYRRIDILAVVDISDPDMQYGQVTMDSSAPWSKPSELHDKDFSSPARYATLEPGRWPLDGTCMLFPDDYTVLEPIGVCNDNLSDSDGYFPTGSPAFVEQGITGAGILQAFSVFFSTDPIDGIPCDFKVEVLQGGTPYFTKEFTNNKETELSIDGFTVNNPDAIRVTVTRWSLPGHRLRMVELIPGIYEKWSSRVLASFSCTMQSDFSCLSLPYGTLNLSMDNRSRRFEPRNKTGIFKSIEARQGIQVYIGVRLPNGSIDRKCLGVFYQAGDGWRTSDNSATMSWSMVDIIGLLSNRTFLPPKQLPNTLDGWIAALVAQLGENFKSKYHVDPEYADTSLPLPASQDINNKTCGDILRWVCMASGVWPRADSETGYLTVEPLWNEGNKVTLSNLVKYPTMSANKDVAALIFTLSDEDGTQYVVSGNSTSSEETVSISNPFISTQEQALKAARLILSCYGGNAIDLTGRGDPSSEIGDVDTVWLDESNATTARRQMQSFGIMNGVLKDCQSHLIQADGFYLFEEYTVITQSGDWVTPANVKNNVLRVAIGQGGQGGGKGQEGYLDKGFSDSGVDAAYGNPGLDGSGGKIWFGTIDINPQQLFKVTIGRGGAKATVQDTPGEEGEETYFGSYSSLDGKTFPNGYTDIANGQSFGRTGVKKPLEGSSDGGKGGAGGDPGIGEWQTVYDKWGNPTGSKFVVHKHPGKGELGSDGASGFVLVSWDKEV